MINLLRSKKDITKFQILVEIMAHQPVVRQKEIADTIGITPQAVSEYTKELMQDDLLYSDGRVRYHVTKKGVEWVLENATDLMKYARFIRDDIITHIAIWPAIAKTKLEKNQQVALFMEDGLLFAKPLTPDHAGAAGVTVTEAQPLDDVGITDIRGMIELPPVEITICKVPRIERGGSKAVNLEKLKKLTQERKYIAALGIEALTALQKINVAPQVFFGSKESVIEAAHHGISSIIVTTDEEVPSLLKRIEQEKLGYRIIELPKNNREN
jgi:putative transcriptional regulator